MNSPVAERQSALTAAFEAFRREPAFGPAALAGVREAAFQRFLERGIPTTRDEEWKFTNVTSLADIAFARADRVAVLPANVAPFELAGLLTIVIVNGRLAPSLSSLGSLPAGVTVRGLSEDAAASQSMPQGHAFVDLNTALFEDGVALSIAPKTVVPTPIHVLCLTVTQDAAAIASPRLVIDVGEQAQVSIVETYAGLGSAQALTNAVTDVRVGASAVVHHVKLQREPAEAYHLASMFAHLSRGATFTSCAATFGGRIARNDIVATLDGEGAECTLNGLYVIDGKSLVDTHTTIDHAKPHCPSHELYKGILAGRSRAVFNGKIIVRPDAQKTDAKQTNKALLLTDDAQINTKPQLEIFADDVKCTHGAAIGQLDEDALFYLRARAISTLDARNMLIHAFARDVIDRITIDVVRAEATHLMETKLRLPEES